MISDQFDQIDHSTIRYSKVWEDYRIAIDGLSLCSEDNVLIVASAGCNVLNLALTGVKSITAIDLSVSQIALTELKVRSPARLSYNEYCSLLGYSEDGSRERSYEKVRPILSKSTVAFWDDNTEIIRAGIQTRGRLDNYFCKFWQGIVDDGLVTWEQIAQLPLFCFLVKSEGYQVPLYQEVKAAFKEYFSIQNMIKFGRHKSQFKYVETSINTGEVLWSRFEDALCRFGIKSNPYMQCFLFGKYCVVENSLPFLNPDNYEKMKQLSWEIKIHHGCLFDFLESEKHSTCNKFYFSNMFEYVSQDESCALFDNILAKAKRKDLVSCCWNFLVDRGNFTQEIASPFRTRFLESNNLFRHDRSWIYSAFWVSASENVIHDQLAV